MIGHPAVCPNEAGLYGPLALVNTASAHVDEKALQRMKARDKVLFRRVRIR